MNHRDRMLAGLPYKARMDGLSQERLENKKKINAFNHLEPDRFDEKEKLLKEILGKTGEYVNIEAPFHCDYGDHRFDVDDYFMTRYPGPKSYNSTMRALREEA